MTSPPSPADPSPPAPPARPPSTGWQQFKAETVRLFHLYANWLVSISWKRFFVLSVLLLIFAVILQHVPPFNYTIGSVADGSHRVTIVPPVPPALPAPPSASGLPAPPVPPLPPRSREPSVKIEKKDSKGGGDVVISIDRDGVRISPHVQIDRNGVRVGPGAVTGGASAAASGSSAAASAPASGAAGNVDETGGIEIKLPPGANSEKVREAVEEARAAVIEAIRESQEKAAEAQQEAAEERAAAAEERASADEKVVRTVRRMRDRHFGDFLTDLAWLIIIASAILKITYKRTIQAEVKAAVATETADSEQLKRQVVEARMAAMQAQVEPHFLFNTLASIDHLIETDPSRASQMQKNLIALLRASMPSMRESTPMAHNLGREMAVIRPYLEILKVRMEERLQTDIQVPEGLLSAEFPSMMIQSLVENAIKHGLEPKAEGGKLTVKAEIVHGKLAVTVADTGLGFGKAATAGTGVGLANIRERIKLLYGDKASMTVADNVPSGTIVTLTVPYQA
ncbi:MAG TPA: histidine kinase, partial [Caldimonas sp.]|nr:histidine kinase [Caldimonas sp.]